jgi:hypothetical protein
MTELRSLALGVVILGALLAGPFGAIAAGPDEPASDRELVLGLRVAPPFVMKTPDGIWTGISVELWRHLAEQLSRGLWQTYPGVDGAAGLPERVAGAGSRPRSAKLCDRSSLRQPAAPEVEHRAGGDDAFLLVARGSRKISRGRIAARTP